MITRRKPLRRSARPLTRTPLRKVSSKRGRALREYTCKRRTFLETHTTCEIGRKGICTHRAGEVHHVHGRGPNLNAVGTWLAVCRCCHDWVHTHPGQARQLGFLE